MSTTFNRADVIYAYLSKESFGDVDIVYSTTDDEPFSVESLQQEFNPSRVVRNGEVTSFDYKELQVDLIHA